MTLQYRFFITSQDGGYWSSWEGYVSGDRIPYAAVEFEIREKPDFEPGYFIDMSLPDERREGAGPREVHWFEEVPVARGWVRVNVHPRS